MAPAEIEEKLNRLGFRKSLTRNNTPIWVNPMNGASAAIDYSQLSIGAETLTRFLEQLQLSWPEFEAA